MTLLLLFLLLSSPSFLSSTSPLFPSLPPVYPPPLSLLPVSGKLFLTFQRVSRCKLGIALNGWTPSPHKHHPLPFLIKTRMERVGSLVSLLFMAPTLKSRKIRLPSPGQAEHCKKPSSHALGPSIF